MGLDTTHNAWHGPYSSFNNFRRWIAKQIDINLSEYEGYGAEGGKDLTTIDHDIMPLLNHSDCDGVLTPDECTQIANGIEKILSTAEKDDFPFSHYESAVTFMKGCRLAASRGEEIEFH